MRRACALLLAAALVAVAASVPEAAYAQSGLLATMGAWSPNAPVIKVGTSITFKATGSADSGVQGFEWDFDGDREPDAYTPADRPGSKRASASIQHAYDSPASLFPAVRAVDASLFVSPWDSLDSAGQPVQLVIGDSAPPQVAMAQWSPYSAAGPDGGPETKFSFSAEASSAAGIARIEWDFDGDGRVDRTARVSGSSARATAEHTYGIAGSWVPRVRAVDASGLPSMWAGYSSAAGSGKALALDTAVHRLAVALEFSPSAARELPATFTFKATVSNSPETFEWDFEGDGVVDSTTSVPTARHTFAKSGLYLPSVTVSDASGLKATAVPTAGNGEPLYIRLLPAAPSAKMEQWSPYVATGAADGEPGTSFTFSASGSSASGGVQKIEWDFDGDGRVDGQTLIAENQLSARATATHSYGAPGNYAPKARAVDAFGQASAWATYSAGARPVTLDVAAGKGLSGETYCGDMTIEQLIASGQYRVFDGRGAVPQKKSITGTAGKDLMIAGAGNTVMRGLGGNDCIIGGPGNDTILGGSGDDLIFGAGGNDRINGNAGSNRIDGGAGQDRCTGASINCEG